MKMRVLLLIATLTMLPMAAMSEGAGIEIMPESTAVDAQSNSALATGDSAPVECPPLTRVKYPFLSCAKDAHGQIVLAGPATVLQTSQLPPMDPFIDNPDFWGR